jgi:hypothetical protein
MVNINPQTPMARTPKDRSEEQYRKDESDHRESQDADGSGNEDLRLQR